MARIAIIGAGVSGLSAGIYAQRNGHSATVYETHFRAGGNLTGWDRHGYHIDNCIHWLTGINPVTDTYKTWQELGALGEGVAVHRSEPMFSFEKDGERLSLGQSLARFERDLLALSPGDEQEIRSLIRAIRGFQRINGIAGEKNDRPSTTAEKLAAIPAVAKYYGMSTGALAERFSHPVIVGLLESMMTDSFSALALLLVFATVTGGNGGVPEGSSVAMAERMADRFLSLGGSLHLGQGVERINVKGGRGVSVTLEGGGTESADYFIVTADPAVTFGKLLDKELMPKQLQRQYEDERLQRFSSYHCAFACDVDALPFRGDAVLEVPKEFRAVLAAEYFLVREFSHEESFAPKGRTVLQAMIYCREDEAREFIALSRDREAYKERKRRIAEAVERIITEKYPALFHGTELLDVWTPATYHRYVGSEMGSWMSFALPAGRLPRRISPRIKGLENVLLATQWLQSPGGLPIAAAAGKEAIGAILKMERWRGATQSSASI